MVDLVQDIPDRSVNRISASYPNKVTYNHAQYLWHHARKAINWPNIVIGPTCRQNALAQSSRLPLQQAPRITLHMLTEQRRL